MALTFHKYHGAGNDFIIIDNRDGRFNASGMDNPKTISALCNRRLGIGADGLMTLSKAVGFDFRMRYYNSDGIEGSMCGNGGRCIAAFAEKEGIAGKKSRFLAIDGPHDTEVLEDNFPDFVVKLRMNDVLWPYHEEEGYHLDTGSPHLVIFEQNISGVNLMTQGRKLRYLDKFSPKGVNVNFAQLSDYEQISMRTYERGVEEETLACGTGAVAVAVAAYARGVKSPDNSYLLKTKGGELRVRFSPPGKNGSYFTDVWLTGPAKHVFSGELP